MTNKQQYELYSNYMRVTHGNEHRNREWIIADIEEYNQMVDNKITDDNVKYVLDQYAGDTDMITTHNTFDEAWSALVDHDSVNVAKAVRCILK